MGGRQSHGGQLAAAPKASKSKAKKNRNLNAFAIAAQQHPEKLKVSRHRLGESEGGSRPGKRSRAQDGSDEDSAEEEPSKKRKGRSNEADEEGSDSEGNEWKMGQVDSDDDSELDSDDAFGESDDEKFEGFAFSGSTENMRKTTKKRSGDINLDEGEDSEGGESDDDSLGEDAIDLAAMLDATEEDGPEDAGHATEENMEGDSGESSDGSGDSDEESFQSLSDDESNDSDDDPDKMLALQRLIANLPQADSSKQRLDRQRSDNASEYATPSGFKVTSKDKLTLEDLGLPSIQDKFVKRSLKLLAAEAKSEGAKNGVSGKLAVPLARREQEVLNRSAAYDKTKETLERWTETVKHNRRAEHLMFPLPDADRLSMSTNTKLQPTTSSKPFNELETAIQSILEQSGLATVDGRTDEDKIAEFEELEANKMSLEEIKARRDQLRMARELMFREEARSKRIKKIKSKSYRRVHRKQREKEERLNKDALLEAGIVPSEDEQEAHDRRRAEERMGSKHRGSKWAKATKDAGRAVWDEDARAAMNEMAVRDEELRKRIEGKSSLRDGADMDEDMSDSDDFDSDDDEGLGDAQRLDSLDNRGPISDTGVGGRLSNMAFMLKADAARKRENDDAVEQLRKELTMGSAEPEAEILEDVGRRSFGPGSQKAAQNGSNETKHQQGSDSEHDEQPSQEIRERSKSTSKGSNNDKETGRTMRHPHAPKHAAVAPTIPSDQAHEGGAWSQVSSRKNAAESSDARRRKQKAHASGPTDELDLTNVSMIAAPFKPSGKLGGKKKSTAAGTTTLLVSSDDDSDDEAGPKLPFAIRDQALIARAFAGADVVGEFEAEKRQAVEDEDEKVVDNTLPGWGSWTGDGLGKKSKARNKGRNMVKTEGIKEKDRKDVTLDKVIINEKRVKKNVKYLASSLPHPFETRAQYERSLRLPVGPEWTTKETFQDATKPRILLKQGIIAPMSKPLA
ncbi:hypothetical protein V496_10188 [Pseudogymnoascus sp. VKM F-4515 (FW-2607)]|nr:hypothetical protein V496_10188 [Pseudogymnoascus sp. VKM F-4515 (FW-2607)]